jgi:four helix bundle protein
MNAEDLKGRTREYALRIIQAVRSLPTDQVAQHMGRQLLRSATSVAANYRAACRSRSRSEFVAKMGVVEEEADESVFWMELLVDAGVLPQGRVRNLLREGNELVAIAVSSKRTARSSIGRNNNRQSSIVSRQSSR